MRYTQYHYHVKDGQFSFDIQLPELLGIEGNIIPHSG